MDLFEKLFTCVDPIGTTLRSVTLKVNNRCPLQCRHCSVGFSDEYAGDDHRVRAEYLVDTIAAIDPLVYDMILLAGGEPSLDPPLLRVAIDACKERPLLSAIVTAPIWAPKSETADRFINRILGLDVLILSYDRYHLEFLDVGHYERAIYAAAQRGIQVVLHICYARESEIPELVNQVAGLEKFFRVHTMRVVPVGNAAKPSNVAMDYVTVESVQDLERIPRGCVLGSVHVDESRTVHGCCWSRSAQRSPFSVPGSSRTMKDTLNELEENELFQTVRAHGFLDSLTPNGRRALVDLVKGRSFTNECHICLAAMNEGDSKIWDEHIDTRQLLPSRQPSRTPSAETIRLTPRPTAAIHRWSK
jgi:organic radical activating enzyme